jgi:protein Tex
MERFAEDADLLGRLRDYALAAGPVAPGWWRARSRRGQVPRLLRIREPSPRSPRTAPWRCSAAATRACWTSCLEPKKIDGEEGMPRCEAMVAERFGIAKQGRAADAWLRDTVRWTWRVKLTHLTWSPTCSASCARRPRRRPSACSRATCTTCCWPRPPARGATIGLDPGLRTGVKVAVVDATGKVLETATIYPHAPRNDWDQSSPCWRAWRQNTGRADRHRQRHRLARDRQAGRRADQAPCPGTAELPRSWSARPAPRSIRPRNWPPRVPRAGRLLRGAVSIARRLQDPLAELVKIDPKSIGVGQYQHDVNPAEAGAQAWTRWSRTA